MDVLSTNSSSKEESHRKQVLDEEIHEDFKSYKIVELMYKKKKVLLRVTKNYHRKIVIVVGQMQYF